VLTLVVAQAAAIGIGLAVERMHTPYAGADGVHPPVLLLLLAGLAVRGPDYPAACFYLAERSIPPSKLTAAGNAFATTLTLSDSLVLHAGDGAVSGVSSEDDSCQLPVWR
jgi:hypothetical protein